MSLDPKIMRLVFSGTGIILVAITVIVALEEATHVAGKHNIIFDSRMITALQDISKILPINEKIITLTSIPNVVYFTGREAGTLHGVTSYSSLITVMDEKGYNYLLVSENESNIPALLKVFNKKNLSTLSNNFTEVKTYITDFNKLHLYKRILSK